MRSSFCRSGTLSLIALCAATASIGALSTSTAFGAETQSGEQRNMVRVGHSDIQGRPAYQPNFIRYPDGRIIAFVGTHGGSAANPLNGGVVEPNGTMIVDVTNPEKPVDKFHIPVPVAGGQAQMARLCLGSVLPKGQTGRV